MMELEKLRLVMVMLSIRSTECSFCLSIVSEALQKQHPTTQGKHRQQQVFLMQRVNYLQLLMGTYV